MNERSMPSAWEAVLRDNQWAILGQDKSVVATLHGKANNETNANLVAASPYMLQALKALSDLIGDEDLPDNGELSGAAVCDFVRTAVALAAGKNYP